VPNGKMTDVVYPTGDGFPFMGATPHVGFNIIAPGAGPGMLVEGADLYQTIYKFENSATHNMTTVGAPEVTETLSSNNDGSTMWRVVFVDATRDGMTTGEYMEVPQGSNAQVLLTNPFGGPITLSNAEFQLSPTQIPLDQLNETSLPSAGPGWTPLPGFPDGTILNVPEPSTWAMMLLGFAGLGLVGYRRARAGHAQLAA
jgi:PEP-CTERM motif